MNPFEMVVVIVVASLVAGLVRAWINRSAHGTALASDRDAHTAQQDARIAQLEQRIQALEAVVGEPGYDLKQRFRDL